MNYKLDCIFEGPKTKEPSQADSHCDGALFPTIKEAKTEAITLAGLAWNDWERGQIYLVTQCPKKRDQRTLLASFEGDSMTWHVMKKG